MKVRKLAWGSWSRYQTIVYVLAFFAGSYQGSQSLLALFTMAVPNTRCFIPTIDSLNGSQEPPNDYNSVFASNLSEHVLGEVAVDSRSEVYCTYCEYGSANVCSQSNLSKTCDFGYVYDGSRYVSTLTTKYNLVCDRIWMRDLIKSIWMFGVLLGSLILGALSDKLTLLRRKSSIITPLKVVLACSLPFFNSYYAMAFVQFAAGFFCCGIFMTVFIIVMELFEGPARTTAGIGMQIAFSSGNFLNGMAAYLLRDWKQLQLTCSLTGLVFVSYIWILPESLTWLIQTRRTAKAVQLKKRIARINGRRASMEFLDVSAAKQEQNEGGASLIELLRQKRLSLTYILTAYNWLTAALTFYGLSWYISDLPGNIYVNCFISAAVDMPAYIISAFMLEYLGRRSSQCIMYLIAGSCFLIAGFVGTGWHATIVAVAIVGRSCVAGAFAMAYNYTAEIFPTEYRNAGTGVCSMFARIGAIASPQILLLGYYVARWVPIVVFGCFALACGSLDLFLPETKGKPLPNSIEDAVRLLYRQKHRQQSERSAPTTEKSKLFQET